MKTIDERIKELRQKYGKSGGDLFRHVAEILQETELDALKRAADLVINKTVTWTEWERNGNAGGVIEASKYVHQDFRKELSAEILKLGGEK